MLKALLLMIYCILGTLVESILSLCRLVSSTIHRRYLFEKRNTKLSIDEDCPFWIHVSSEGELEQVSSILIHILKSGSKVLLLFTSPSVEKKITTLCKKHKNLYSSSFNFVYKTSLLKQRNLPKVFFMVRYDFFPKLIMITRNKGVKSVLINASLKNKNLSLLKRIWFSTILSSFDVIFWANVQEKRKANLLNILCKNYDFDFRNERILDRQKDLSIHMSPLLQKLRKDKVFKNKLIILGSLWANIARELKEQLIELKELGFIIMIAPHVLKGEDYQNMCDLFSPYKQWHSLEEPLDFNDNGDIILCHISGILCNLYPLFGHCYVDGGFGRSVHSLLEPFWGGGHVYCGPATMRSTEYDYINETKPQHITILPALNKFKDTILCNQNELDDLAYLRDDIYTSSVIHKQFINKLID